MTVFGVRYYVASYSVTIIFCNIFLMEKLYIFIVKMEKI